MRDNFYDCRYVYRDIVLCIMDLCYNGYNSKYYNDNCSIKINNKEEKDKQKISIEKRGIAIMSSWTYVDGIINVRVPGRTQHEMNYIINTILDHLPLVTGSEEDMYTHIIQHDGYNTSSSDDEYQCVTDHLKDWYGNNTRDGMLRTNDVYTIHIHGHFRDRLFDQTFREFMKWLCRLCKRLDTDLILVNIRGYDKQYTINIPDTWNTPYRKMYEYPSWARDNDDYTPAWWEHLMWDRYKNCSLPLSLIYKYYDNEDANEEFKRRCKQREEKIKEDD